MNTDNAGSGAPRTTWQAPIKHLPGIERVHWGYCVDHPDLEFDHMIAGCAHWRVGTADICVAPCIPVPENRDDLPVAVIHEYAHFLVGGDTSGQSIVIAHGRKWRDKFSDLLEFHGWERPVPFDAHTGVCDQTINMRAPSDDDVAMCEFEIDVNPMIWQIFESETRLRNSTEEKTIEDFMQRFASRDPLDKAYRVMNSDAMRSWNDIPNPLTLTLTKSKFDAFRASGHRSPHPAGCSGLEIR